MKTLQHLPVRQPFAQHPSSSSSSAVVPGQPAKAREAIQAETASSRSISLANQPLRGVVGCPTVRGPMHQHEEILMLQRTIGNQAVGRLLRASQRREQPPITDLASSRQEQPGERESAPQVNRTGLPDALKARVEQLSGLSLDDVRVHYHSSKPAEMQVSAYTQGTEIHVGPGQEEHLAHEAWHVVQQKQGRVQPTSQIEGVAMNDDPALEHEADVMPTRWVGVATRQCLDQQPFPPQNIPIQCGTDLQRGDQVKVYLGPDVSPKTGEITFTPSGQYQVKFADGTKERFDRDLVFPVGMSDEAIQKAIQESIKQEEKKRSGKGVKEEIKQEEEKKREGVTRNLSLEDRKLRIQKKLAHLSTFSLPLSVVQTGKPSERSQKKLGNDLGYTDVENLDVVLDASLEDDIWHGEVKGLTGMYSIQAQLLPDQKEITGPGGNTTQDNYQDQIKCLLRYGAGTRTEGPSKWYMLKAVQDHEQAHAEHMELALKDAAYEKIRELFKNLSVPGRSVSSASEAVDAIKKLPEYSQAVEKATKAWGTSYDALSLAFGDHEEGGPCQKAEQQVIEPMIRTINDYAVQHGWGPSVEVKYTWPAQMTKDTY